MWCGIINDYLMGPYCFNSNVNGPYYSSFLKDQLSVLIVDVNLYIRLKLWIQLNGARPHLPKWLENISITVSIILWRAN